jgi:hypothetical protein
VLYKQSYTLNAGNIKGNLADRNWIDIRGQCLRI